jgi:hypothetical protein
VSSVGEATLPLRPLTVGELLDAGITLLRRHPGRLLGLAAALALAEQLALLPLRIATHRVPPNYLPDWWDALGGFWLVLAVGAGTEVVAVTLVGAAAARRAVPALLGTEVGPPRIGPLRWTALTALALGLGVLGALAFGLGVLGWVFLLACTGLVGPVYVVDLRPARPAGAGPLRPAGVAAPRPIGFGRAIGRGLGLAFRSGLRPGAVRLVNYLAWLLVRLALGWGLILTVRALFDPRSDFWLAVLAMTGFGLADAVAYAAAGSLDAVLHLEARIRLEGLDVAAGNARRRRQPLAGVLVVPVAPQPGAWTGRPLPTPAPGLAGPPRPAVPPGLVVPAPGVQVPVQGSGVSR